MPKIDDAEYRAGREEFATGGSLRDVIAPIVDDDAVYTHADEDKQISRLLCFVDGLINKIRSL